MSIAQKGTTWLPRFLRKNDPLLADDRLDSIPLDDRMGPPSNGEPSGVATVPIVHKLSCVDPRARLAEGVEIGPFCVIGPDVSVGAGTKIQNNVTIVGHTVLGANNLVFPNTVLGTIPQDKKFGGETTRLEIGDNNHIRENVTIHLGTGNGGGLTKIGSNNLLMVGVHLGHDVRVGDHCILANNVLLAGHVHLGNHVVLSGAVGIHHFVTVGDYAYSTGMIKINRDVPPFVKIDDDDRIRAVNSLGLRRNGFADSDISAIERAVWKLFLDKDRVPMNVLLGQFRDGAFPELSANAHVLRVIEFLERRNLGKHGRYLESQRAG